MLSFNQELADDDALTLVLSCNNQVQDTGIPEPDADALIVTVAINTPLPRSTCSVVWTLRDGLGETIVGGQSTFGVLEDPPAGSTSGTTATDSTSPFITVPAVTAAAPSSDQTENPGSSGGAVWLGRLLSTLGILVVFGGLALISVGWPEGPEYVVTVRFLRSAWLLSLAGTVLYLIAFASDFNNVSFGSAVSPGSWLDLNDAGWEGRGALLRLVFIAASGWVAMRPERIIDPHERDVGVGDPRGCARRRRDEPRRGHGGAARVPRQRRSTCSPSRCGSAVPRWSRGSCSPGRAKRTSCRPLARSAGSRYLRSSSRRSPA